MQETPRGSAPPNKQLVEMKFVFAVVWAVGGCLLSDKVANHRAAFSSWWTKEFKSVPFPDKVITFVSIYYQCCCMLLS
jgi:hypothetical protein